MATTSGLCNRHSIAGSVSWQLTAVDGSVLEEGEMEAEGPALVDTYEE